MVLVGLVPLAGCAAVEPNRELKQVIDDHSIVERAARAIIDADNAADLQSVLDCYTEDVVWIPPEDEPIRGRAAIEPRYREMFAAYQPNMTITIDDIQITNDLAIARGGTLGELAPRAAGTPVSVRDNFLMLLRRDEAGRWRISLLMWNKRGQPEN